MFHEPTLEPTKSELHLKICGGGGGANDDKPSRPVKAPQSARARHRLEVWQQGGIPSKTRREEEEVVHHSTTSTTTNISPISWDAGNGPAEIKTKTKTTTPRNQHNEGKLIQRSPRNEHPKLISKTSNGFIYSIETTNLLLDAKATAITTTTPNTQTKRNKSSSRSRSIRATRYNQNISLMRSFLVNYLKLTICTCFETAALVTLLVFVLCLNNLIEAHQHNHNHHHQNHNNNQHQHGHHHQQTTRRLGNGAGLRAGPMMSWNGTSANTNHRHNLHQTQQLTRAEAASMAASKSIGRARRSAEGFGALGSPFAGGILIGSNDDAADQQQRPLIDLDEIDGVIADQSSRVELILAPAGSELLTLIGGGGATGEAVEPNNYDISRVPAQAVSTTRLSLSESSPKMTAAHQQYNKNVASSTTTRNKLEIGMTVSQPFYRLNRTAEQPIPPVVTRNKQGSHNQRQQQQVPPSGVTSSRLDSSDQRNMEMDLSTAALDRAPDWSYRQAAAPGQVRPVTPGSVISTTTTTTTTTTTKRPHSNDQQQQHRAHQPTSKPRSAMDENHWIPIERSTDSRPTAAGSMSSQHHHHNHLNNHQLIVPLASSRAAASALLDYPPAQMIPKPARQQTPQLTIPPDSLVVPAGPPPNRDHQLQLNEQQPNNRPGVELQQLGSHGYGERNPSFVEYRARPPRPHAPSIPSYEHLELGNHHHHHSHNHQQLHHQHHHHHWPRRRPRYQGELDNEIGPGPVPVPPIRASKIYKRVLLCDKTLVSLDYIRYLDLEPRPTMQSGGGQLLNEHEINEINDNFLDLEISLESSMARLNSALGGVGANDSNTRRRSSSVTSASAVGQSATTSINSTTTNGAQPTGGSPGSPSTGPASGSGRAQQQVSGGINNGNNNTNKDTNTRSPSHQPQQPPTSATTSEPDRMAANESSADQLTASMPVASLQERSFWGHGGSGNLLSDEDPLVRCDMWDLEKGLKSRKPPEPILRMAIKADFDTVRDAINRCRQLSQRTLPPDDEFRGDGLEIMSTEDLMSLFSMKRGLMPGTKWCGLGDQANSYNDLGPKHRIDICCRAHDHCPIRSKPFRNDYGVLNIGLYTKSHCDCDADFYRCLREVRSRTADMLGNLYFNVMKLQCMREERLKVCREMKPIALGFERCVRYEDSPVKTVFKFTTPPVAY